MKLSLSKQAAAALTRVEVLVIIVIMAVLAVVFSPVLLISDRRPYRIECLSNLQQIGIAYRIWAGDNNGKYPMEVSATNGGTMELADGRNAWINYYVMSNTLNTPKVLRCPLDTNGFAVTNFSFGFNNQNVSYFVGLDASVTHPHVLLSGDYNFAVGNIPVKSGLLELSTNTPLTWTAARHKFAGNIGFADGSVQQGTRGGLQKSVQQTGVATNRLAIP
jgi:prepilin-type processing-associated H-X9-DG protein